MEDYNHLIGKTVTEAREELAPEMVIRVNSIDGNAMVGTCDFRTDRLNVMVTEGKISAIKGLG